MKLIKTDETKLLFSKKFWRESKTRNLHDLYDLLEVKHICNHIKIIVSPGN